MVKKIVSFVFDLGLSKTARSLYWVFSGNGILIVLTFFTTILIANSLTKAENGIFLALLTLANLLSDLGEAGLGSSLSSFIPGLLLESNETNKQEAQKYLATAFKLELIIGLILGSILAVLSVPISKWLFASTQPINVFITALITFILVLFGFSIFALSAFKKFREVSVVNIFYSLVRLGLLVVALLVFKVSLLLILLVYLIAFTSGWVYSLLFLKTNFLFAKASKSHTNKLLKFSSFLAIQKLFISISSRLDLLMLVPLSNAVEAGVYGIAQRFSLVYPLVISSLGQVLAPQFAEFGKGRHALQFLKKAGIIIGLLLISELLFYIFAKPLIVFLIPKYVEAITVFQALLIATTGFIIATPFVSFIIYTLKKPYITTISSFIQLVVIFISNLYFIPRYGRMAPAIGIGIGNVVICIIAISASFYYLRKEV